MGSSSDFDLTRADADEPRRGSVTQLRQRARPAAPPVVDEGDDWPTDNARSLAVPSPKPAAAPPVVGPTRRADAFNLQANAANNPPLDPRRDGASWPTTSTARAGRQPRTSPGHARSARHHSSQHLAFAHGAAADIRALLARPRLYKPVLIAAVTAVALLFTARQVYDAMNATTSRGSSTTLAKVSSDKTATSPTINHSTTASSAVIERKASHPRRATHRTRHRATRRRTASTRHEHPKRAISTAATSPVPVSQHPYTPPTPISTAATRSSTQATSARTPPTSTSSSTKTPAFGANGALGPGSSPDG